MSADPSDPRALPRGGAGVPSLRQTLLHTLPGRLLVIGAIVKGSTWLLRVAGGVEVPFLDVIGAVGSLVVIACAVYFLYHLIVRAKRRLLWRVRRKLILSYIFVGVVPVLLVFAFFLLGGLLLLLNFGGYLVTRSVHTIVEDAQLIAQQTTVEIARAGAVPERADRAGHASAGGRRAAQEAEQSRQRLEGQLRDIVARQGITLARHYPAASLAVVTTAPEPCGIPAPLRPEKVHPAAGQLLATVGPWSHLSPPQVVPSWVSCSGFAGLIDVSTAQSQAAGAGLGLVARAVALPRSDKPGFAVIVDIPLDTEMKARIREETSVKVGQVNPGAPAVPQPTIDAGPDVGALFKSVSDDTRKRRFPSFTVLDYLDWTTGLTDTASMAIEVNVADIYERVSVEQWRLFILGALGIFAILFVIIEVVALVMGLVLARSITGSVHELFAGTERVRQGDFGHKIRIISQDQMGELAESFNSMTGSIEDLLRQAEEKKRLEEELRIARAIQMSLLPRGQMSVPGLSITALCVPAREVGGDYYDLLPLPDGRLGVLIADVAGKGTSAALYMAELKGLILSLCRIHTSPRQLLIEANRIIASNLDSRSFITMMYAVIDQRAGTMTYARAGHTPLMRRTADHGEPAVQVLAPDGLVVGLQMDDGGALFERLLKEETLPLRQGDLYMFFTDGVTEAMNAQSDCFGDARLGEILAEHGDLPSEQLRERILREIEAFVAGAPQHDDMTMILLRVEETAAVIDRPRVVRGAVASSE